MNFDPPGTRFEALNAPCVNLQLPTASQRVDALQNLWRQSMTMDIPLRTQMAHEALSITLRHALPDRRRHVSHEGHRLAPIAAAFFRFGGQQSHCCCQSSKRTRGSEQKRVAVTAKGFGPEWSLSRRHQTMARQRVNLRRSLPIGSRGIDDVGHRQARTDQQHTVMSRELQILRPRIGHIAWVICNRGGCGETCGERITEC